MTQMPTGRTDAPDAIARCGCCGRSRERTRLAELGQTPGVYICVGCALWAARRARGITVSLPVRAWWERLVSLQTGSMARTGIPILTSSDLARTEEFYARLGFDVAGRYDGYLVTHDGPVELHFSHQPGVPVSPGTCFVHVRDAKAYWKRLRERDIAGLGDPAEQAYGLVEFVVLDPDGNRVRFGSPAN